MSSRGSRPRPVRDGIAKEQNDHPGFPGSRRAFEERPRGEDPISGNRRPQAGSDVHVRQDMSRQSGSDGQVLNFSYGMWKVGGVVCVPFISSLLHNWPSG